MSHLKVAPFDGGDVGEERRKVVEVLAVHGNRKSGVDHGVTSHRAALEGVPVLSRQHSLDRNNSSKRAKQVPRCGQNINEPFYRSILPGSAKMGPTLNLSSLIPKNVFAVCSLQFAVCSFIVFL